MIRIAAEAVQEVIVTRHLPEVFSVTERDRIGSTDRRAGWRRVARKSIWQLSHRRAGLTGLPSGDPKYSVNNMASEPEVL